MYAVLVYAVRSEIKLGNGESVINFVLCMYACLDMLLIYCDQVLLTISFCLDANENRGLILT